MPTSEPGAHLAAEAPVALEVEGRRVAGWLCTPVDLTALAAGWLVCEGIIREPDEILELEADSEAGVVRARLAPRAHSRLLKRDAVHLGGGSIAVAVARESVPADPPRCDPRLDALLADRAALTGLFEKMFESASLRRRGGGVHTGALARDAELLQVAEDVGRHNVVDRLVGRAIHSGHPLRGSWILLSGRISAVTAAKACRAGVAALATLSIPTTLARDLARRCGITLVARARSAAPQLHRP